MTRDADNLSPEQYDALTPFIKVAMEMKLLLDSYPEDYNVGPPFTVKEWRALLDAFTKQP